MVSVTFLMMGAVATMKAYDASDDPTQWLLQWYVTQQLQIGIIDPTSMLMMGPLMMNTLSLMTYPYFTQLYPYVPLSSPGWSMGFGIATLLLSGVFVLYMIPKLIPLLTSLQDKLAEMYKNHSEHLKFTACLYNKKPSVRKQESCHAKTRSFVHHFLHRHHHC